MKLPIKTFPVVKKQNNRKPVPVRDRRWRKKWVVHQCGFYNEGPIETRKCWKVGSEKKGKIGFLRIEKTDDIFKGVGEEEVWRRIICHSDKYSYNQDIEKMIKKEVFKKKKENPIHACIDEMKMVSAAFYGAGENLMLLVYTKKNAIWTPGPFAAENWLEYKGNMLMRGSIL